MKDAIRYKLIDIADGACLNRALDAEFLEEMKRKWQANYEPFADLQLKVVEDDT